MTDQIDITLTPFSLRHRRLLNDRVLEDLPLILRNRLWNTVRELSEPYYFSLPDNPNWVNNSSDLEQAELLYDRLLGRMDEDGEKSLGTLVVRGRTEECLDVLECFCAWVDAEGNRLARAQKAINKALQDFNQPWRMSEGLVFQVDNDFLEDEILAQASPLLALAEFKGAHDEFIRARDHLTEGNARDAIGYAHASVESTFKAAIGSAGKKYGNDLPQTYANADLLTGLPKGKAQAIQKALSPTATLRNELSGHGQGEDILDIPHEYGMLAVGLAAVINAFITRQHLARIELATPLRPTPKAADKGSSETRNWDLDDIPF
jgi:hypothetical protein